MAALCYITTCKGRLAHLKQTLPRIVNQPDVSCVVVDYACPDGTADWVLANFPQVVVVRVTREPGFHLARARNLGAQAANAPWLAFFDADILWSQDFAKTMIPRLQAGHFYRAEPVTSQTWGSIICHRQDFDAIGGYDEAFHGWGGEDDDLRRRLTALGCVPAGFPASLVDEIAHDDETRFRFHQVKDRVVQHRINSLYTKAKLDLHRLLGRPLPLATRQELFDEVGRAILQSADAKQQAVVIEVNLPPELVTSPPVNGVSEKFQVNRKMTYSTGIAAHDPGAGARQGGAD